MRILRRFEAGILSRSTIYVNYVDCRFEHSLKRTLYIINLGPEGGNGGGRIAAAGTPEDVAEIEASHTGRYLLPMLVKAGRMAAE